MIALPPITLHAEPGRTVAWSAAFPKRDLAGESILVNGLFWAGVGPVRDVRWWGLSEPGLSCTIVRRRYNSRKDLVFAYATGDADQTVTVRVTVMRP